MSGRGGAGDVVAVVPLPAKTPEAVRPSVSAVRTGVGVGGGVGMVFRFCWFGFYHFTLGRGGDGVSEFLSEIIQFVAFAQVRKF